MIQDGRLKAYLSLFQGRSLNLLIVAIVVLLLMMAPVFSGVNNNVTSGNTQIQATSPVIQAINASNIGYVKNTYVMTNHTVVPGDFTNISTGVIPTSAIYDPVNGYVYSVNFGGQITVINSTTNMIVKTIVIPYGGYGITYDPNNGLIFVPSYYNNSVSVINTTTNRVVHTVSSYYLYYPYSAAYDASNNYIYVTDYGSDYVTLINATTFAVYSASYVYVGLYPVGIAYDPNTGFMYVGNWNDGTVTVLNGTSTVSTITVGSNPEGLVYDSYNGYIYVANYGGTVSVINPSTNLVQKSINVGQGAYWAIYDSNNHDVYVENQGYNNVTVISGSTNTVIGSISTGSLSSPSGGAFDPANNHIFVEDLNDNTISVINATTNTLILTINIGDTPWGIAYDPYSGNLFITNTFGNNVTVINATTLAFVTSIQVPYEPYQIAFDPANGYIYVVEYGTGSWGSLTAINGYTNKIVITMNVGSDPTGVAYDASNGYLYVTNYYSSNVTVINSATNSVIGSIYLGTSPGAVAYDSALGYIYVTNELSNTVSIINDMSVVATVTVGTYPYSIAYDSSNGYMYVTDANANNVTVLNGATVKTTITGFNGPGAIGYDPANGFIYVSTGGTNLTAINGTSVGTTQLQISFLPTAITYDYENGYLFTSNYNGSVSQIAFNKTPTATYAVSFNEVGLPSGSVWSVTFNGITTTTNATSVFYTIQNGTYSYSVSSSYPVTPSTGTIIVNGKNVATSLSFETLYKVTFSETGLYSGVTWYLTFNGNTTAVTKSTTISVTPGNYTYSIARVSGYLVSPSSGYVNLTSSNANIVITFTPVYNVTFKETGLPNGDYWSVTLDYFYNKYTTTSSSITFTNFTNATNIPYTVSGTSPYYPNPSNGTVNIAGSDIVVNIVFKPLPEYKITFIENGLSPGTLWSVVFDGIYNSSTTSTIGFTAFNGTYSFYLNAVSGYTTYVTNGTVYVHGTNVYENITYVANSTTPHTYTVTFTESGLPSGTYWYVNLGSYSVASTTSSLNFQVTNGSYSFSAYASGYTAYPQSGTITVSGSAVTENIVFVSGIQPYYNISFSETGLYTGAVWNVTFAGTYNTTYAGFGTLSFFVQNGTYNFTVTAYGYTSTPSSGQITVSGSNLVQSISFTANTGLYPVTLNLNNIAAGFTGIIGIYIGNISQTQNTSSTQLVYGPLEYSGTATAYLPNGTYTFVYEELNSYLYNGNYVYLFLRATLYAKFSTFNILGSPLTINADFQSLYSVTINAAGLYPGTLWGLSALNSNFYDFLSGSAIQSPEVWAFNYSTGYSLNVILPPGTYYYYAITEYGISPVIYSAFNDRGSWYSGISGYTTNITYPQFNVTNSNITINIKFAKEYNLTFTEAGLPSGTPWYIDFNGTELSSNSSSISVAAPNGTYYYYVYPVGGYTGLPASGNVTISGANANEQIHFTLSSISLYTVTFSETGLPSGTQWDVKLNGTTTYSTTSSLTFTLPDGTYSYSVSTSNTLYGASGGTVTVSGSNNAVSVTFSQSSYTVTFSKTGLPSNDVWYVNITDSSNKITSYHGTGGISVSLLDGTYSYTIASANKDYAPSKYHGTFTVNGAGITVSTITFSLVTYKVTFSESGLPSGNTWYVNITGGTQLSTSTSSDNVLLQNGTYTYTVATQDKKYSSKGGTFTVSGSPQQESLTYSPVTYKVTFNETGLKSGTSWSVTFNGASKSSTGSTITFSVQNGTYAFSTKSVTGYRETGSSGNLTINGAQISHTVKFTSTTTTTTPPGYGGLSFNTETLAIIGLFVAIVVIGAAIGISRRKK